MKLFKLLILFSVNVAAAKSVATCSTGLVHNPDLGEIYYQVSFDGSGNRQINVNAFDKESQKIAIFKGTPALKEQITNGVRWTAENIYKVDSAGAETLLKDAYLAVEVNKYMKPLVLFFNSKNGLVDPTACWPE